MRVRPVSPSQCPNDPAVHISTSLNLPTQDCTGGNDAICKTTRNSMELGKNNVL